MEGLPRSRHSAKGFINLSFNPLGNPVSYSIHVVSEIFITQRGEHTVPGHTADSSDCWLGLETQVFMALKLRSLT